MAETNLETVAIIGAGTIGASWSALFAAAGYELRIYDPSPRAETYVRDYVETAWPTLEKLGRVRPGRPPSLSFFDTPRAAAEGPRFVQESVPEQLHIKHDIYGRIEPVLAVDAVVATSASGLQVSELQQGWKDPGRLVLGHPFNPPHVIPLVELSGNGRTDPAALDQAQAFYESCGKVTIRIKREVPGHVANRLQAALWREAIHLVVEGVASVEDVDKAMIHGPGLRWAVMGPHMLFNLGSGGSGLEVFCDRYGESFQRWWQDLGTPRLTPETARTLAEGVRCEEAGRDFPTLAAERDAKLIAVLNALAEVESS